MAVFQLYRWDEKSLDFPGYNLEGSLEVLSLRVLLPPRLIRLVREAVLSLVELFDSHLFAVSSHALAAASQALSDAASPSSGGPSLRLSARVRGPLLILPSPSSPTSGAMLQMADVSASIGRATDAQGRPVERCTLEMSHGRFVVAAESGAMQLDYTLRPSYRCNWVFREAGGRVTVDRPAKLSGGSSELHSRVVLSPFVVSLAYSELKYLVHLLTEAVEIMHTSAEEDRSFTPPLLPLAEDVEDTSWSSFSSGFGKERVRCVLDVESEEGARIVLLTDLHGSLRPLYEMGLSRTRFTGMLAFSNYARGQVGGGGLALAAAEVQLKMEVGASYLNANNGTWEPIVEPWELVANYQANSGDVEVGALRHSLTLTSARSAPFA